MPEVLAKGLLVDAWFLGQNETNDFFLRKIEALFEEELFHDLICKNDVVDSKYPL